VRVELAARDATKLPVAGTRGRHQCKNMERGKKEKGAATMALLDR
jgi:hypothetical protein